MSQINCFFNTCPKKLKRPPKQVCSLGTLDAKGQSKCVWGINSEKHQNCFWNLLKKRSDADGDMIEMSTDEIAKLLNQTEAETTKELNLAQKSLDLAVHAK